MSILLDADGVDMASMTASTEVDGGDCTGGCKGMTPVSAVFNVGGRGVLISEMENDAHVVDRICGSAM